MQWISIGIGLYIAIIHEEPLMGCVIGLLFSHIIYIWHTQIQSKLLQNRLVILEKKLSEFSKEDKSAPLEDTTENLEKEYAHNNHHSIVNSTDSTSEATTPINTTTPHTQEQSYTTAKTILDKQVSPLSPAITNISSSVGNSKQVIPEHQVSQPIIPEKDQSSWIYNIYNYVHNWLLGGNTILRVGAIILFLGLAFLLRYATEDMTFPIWGRYLSVAFMGFGLVGLGWYLRHRVGNYGLILQGVGIGVLYLTIYAANYLHQLFPSHIVFILLVSITIISVSLSLLQNALSLAIAAALGGFAAPILASSGEESHVSLFSYFILLNMNILTIAIGVKVKNTIFLDNSFFIQLLAGIVYIINIAVIQHSDVTTIPFLHFKFIIPFTLSCVAFFSSWLFNLKSNHHAYSRILLVWASCWWFFAFIYETVQTIPSEYWQTTYLLILAISFFFATWISRITQWRDMSLMVSLLIPIATITFLIDTSAPFSHFGLFAWVSIFFVHLFSLKKLSLLIPKNILSFCHIVGVWLLIGILSKQAYYLLTLRSMYIPNSNDWYWIIWIIFPCIWLLIICYWQSPSWPIKDFNTEYCVYASAPLAIITLSWFWIANLLANGTIPGVRYIPIINPLELGLLLALMSSLYWSHKYLINFITFNTVKKLNHILVYTSLFALVNIMVFRYAYHWIGIPFILKYQLQSMLIQASLSIVWTFIALTLMIIGHNKIFRNLWLVGAILISLVVIKLFFVELNNNLERIISFIVVGVLLLTVGYFAPLPPKRQ